MTRVFAPALFVLLFLSAGAACAQRDVPVWYLQYEVGIKADFTAATSTLGGPTTTRWVFDRTISASSKLDMRMEGSLFGMNEAMGTDPEKLKNMSQAEMMKYSQQMLETMQYAANWMPAPPELGDDPDAMLKHMKSGAVPVRFRYHAITTGKDLVNELNQKFEYEETKTGSASGGMLYLGDQYKFEVNTKSKKYWLMLPYTGNDLDSQGRGLKWETVRKTRTAGSSDWVEQREASDASIEWLPALKIEGLDPGSETVLIEGVLPGADRVSGEKTYQASFADGQTNVPVTITFRYTLTSTPPASGEKK